MKWWDAWPGLRESVLAWLESVRCRSEPWGRYRYCAGMTRPWAVESSCMAVKILDRLDVLRQVPEADRRAHGRFLCSLQDPKSGLIVDPLVGPADKVSDSHPWEHVWGHVTGVVIQTLPLLGAQLATATQPSDDPQRPEEVAPFLEALPWAANPWRCGTLIGQFMGRQRVKAGLYDSDREDTVMAAVYAWLEARQDPQTGLWGTDRCPQTYKAMAGLHCMSTGTYYLPGRPLPRPEKIIDSILAMQRPNGEFGVGGSCMNLDATNGLANALRFTRHRRDEVVAAVRRLAARIMAAYKRPDGAFASNSEAVRQVHNSIFIAPPAFESEMRGTSMYLVVLRKLAQLERGETADMTEF